MIFRRILAGFFVFLFVLAAIPTFFVYGISKTFLNPEFFKGPIVDGTYDFVVNATAQKVYKNDSTLSKHFQEGEVDEMIRKSFSKDNLRTVLVDFATQIDHFKSTPQSPLVLNLKVLRQGIISAVDSLAAQIFEKIPLCVGDQLPEVNEEGIPTCVPTNINSEAVSAPIAKQFERSVNMALPEQVQLDLSSHEQGGLFLGEILAKVDVFKISLLVVLLFLLAVIAMLVFEPFSMIAYFIGLAFMISGFFGFLLTFSLGQIPAMFLKATKINSDQLLGVNAGKDSLQRFLEYLFSFYGGEVQKISLIFLVVGGGLILIHVFLKREFVFLKKSSS